jgi:hypothetical protein
MEGLEIDEAGEALIETKQMDHDDWIDLADRSYQDSTTYIDSGFRTRWEKNYALAASRHPNGSKYYSEQYKHRSKLFRGKTAAALRRNLAACAVALFSTQDVVNVEAENDNEEAQKIAARALKQLTNYHMTTHIPWFQLAIGGYREGLVNGVVAAKYWWDYTEGADQYADGGIKVVADKPVIELLPIENCRFSPAASWTDPVNSSPYFIITWPMFVADIKARMLEDWYFYDDGEISQAVGGSEEFDSTRRAREGGKRDSKAEPVSVKDHDVAWVREVFIRVDGEEYHYYTLDRSILLSEPAPLKSSYPHCADGRRPVIMGQCEIEPHTVYCQGLPERVEGLQIEANDIGNQRRDNVALVLNRRTYAQRGKNTDYHALQKSVPGQVIMTDDVNSIKPEVMPDITGSSFNEQNLVNMDFDELAGTFSTASVATNRQLNETVGGMQLLSGNTNILAEFQLKIYVETFTEPLVKGVVSMIRTYEEDGIIQAVTGDKSLTHASLRAKVQARVNVGFGATDPQRRIEKLMYGLGTLQKIMPDLPQVVDPNEISGEVFGALGWKDGARFVPGLKSGGNPQVQMLTKQLQQMQQQMQMLQQQMESRMAEKKIDLQIAQLRMQTERQEEMIKYETARLESQAEDTRIMVKIKADMEKEELKIAGGRAMLADETKVKLRFGSGL